MTAAYAACTRQPASPDVIIRHRTYPAVGIVAATTTESMKNTHSVQKRRDEKGARSRMPYVLVTSSILWKIIPSASAAAAHGEGVPAAARTAQNTPPIAAMTGNAWL